MIATKEKHEVFLRTFAEVEKRRKAPAWLERGRNDAILRFADLGFPTTHDEAWKYTNVAPLAAIPFELSRYEFNSGVAQQIERSPFAGLGCPRLTFINGHYCPELSKTSDLPKEVRAGSLANALATGAGSTEDHFSRYADFSSHAFVALNTAMAEDGAWIEVPKGLIVEKPINLLFISTHGANPVVSHPRNLIVVGRESQVSVIEAYVGLDGSDGSPKGSHSPGAGVYFTNAVTEIVAGENAVVRYAKVQEEANPSYHVATVRVEQERSSNVSTCSVALGSALTREEIFDVLDGEGAECTLDGLYVIAGEQHVDNHTTIDHAKPHCSSREFYKGVLDGRSTGVFNGRIIVRQDAQKTDSKQSNKNLLLAEGCVINTKPQLEIFADDVKCTHGATIGQIDPEAVFYLRSRGIGMVEARSLLTYAFANDIIGRIAYAPLAGRLRDALFARFGGDPGKEKTR